MSVKTTPAQHQSNLRNVYGTFAIEGMTISKDTRRNLDRIGSGQSSYQQVVNKSILEYAPGRVANSLGNISCWSQSCSKHLATASFTVVMKFTSL